MHPDWLIIDGYNLLHQVNEIAGLLRSDIQLARHRLVRKIEKTAHRMASKTTIVFDGREAGLDVALTSNHMEIYFSPAGLSADTIIERLVSRYNHPENMLVVTSDRAEANAVLSDGAQVMSIQDFLDQCCIDERKTVSLQTPHPREQPKLGDIFPDGL
ncbi:MAG TPA: NYN domain-containing protein [Pontiella sp.]